MDNTNTIILISLVVLGLVLLGFYTFQPGPKEKVETAEITVKEVPATKVASISEQGPYGEMGQVLGELYGWLSSKGVKPAGMPLGIYYDDPNEVAPQDLRYKVCIPISQDMEGDERVTIETLPAITAATIVHKGPYSGIGSAWGKLATWVEKKGYQFEGTGREVYLNDPESTPEDELLTEIQIPIKK